MAGLLAGALSGYFLQTIALTVVTANGSLNERRPPEVFFIEALTVPSSGASPWRSSDL